MRKPFRVAIALAVVALVGVMLAVPFYAPTARAADATRATLIFTVGGQDQMKTRNWLPAIANDVWTSDVLGRVYDTVGQTHPATDALVPYIIKGVDDNGDGIFQATEKSDFLKNTCPAPCADPVAWRRNITAYYDFNGVRFHDGVQAAIGDVMFNYVFQSMNPRFNTDMRVLWSDPNAAAFPPDHKMNIQWIGCGPTSAQFPLMNWEGTTALPGDPMLRCGLRFFLKDDFALFYRSTLAGLTLFPRHEFEGNGAGRHPSNADWGYVVYPETWADPAKRLQGVPTGETAIAPFNYPAAEAWQMTDGDVIGTGPFKFVAWAFGQYARVDKNRDFFWGVDNTKQPGDNGYVLDPYLPTYMHQPFIDEILFKIYKTTPLGVLALTSGDIDFYHWNVPPEFVPPLLNEPTIRVWSNAEPGFFYLSYNMRRQPFGYTTYPPADSRADDAGLALRTAIAHLIDKQTIVRVLLQNYGVIADGVVTPANSFWYNASLPKYPYSTVDAAAILNAQGWTDPPGDCLQDGSGCRSLPMIGTRLIEILTPQADYDPIRASAGATIASAARSVGLNINSKATAFGAITAAIDARAFDMFILGWRIGGTDPDYMFSFFHSSNAAAGQNYPGFYDTEFDNKISSSRKELNEAVRQQQIKDAQGILSKRLPYDVLYYRTNIEAQREDKWVNFTVSSGTIWNYWSLIGMKQPTNVFIKAVTQLPSAMSAGTSTAVTTTVRDQDGVAVTGATVTLTAAAGNFSGLGCTSGGNTNSCTGTTGSAGTLTVAYDAPATVPPNPNVEILIRSQAPDPTIPFDSRTKIITIFAPGTPFLSITPLLTTGDLVPEGETLVFGVDVRDQDGNLANSATVTLTTNNVQAQVVPVSGPASALRSSIQFHAPASIATSPASFIVTVNATLTGFEPASTTIDFTVVKITSTVTCPDGTVVQAGTPCPTRPIPSLGVLPILATIGIAAVVYSVIRRRKKGA